MLEEGPREVPDFSQGRVREDSQKELQSSYGGDHPPLLSTRKRSSSLRGSMELEEDGSSITVLQEADSTVNFEPPPLDGMEEITSKRLRGSSRRAEVEEREEGEVEGEEGGEAESLKSLLEKNSVTQAVESGRGGGKGERGGGGGGGGGGGSSEEHTVVLGSSRSEHASDSMQGINWGGGGGRLLLETWILVGKVACWIFFWGGEGGKGEKSKIVCPS